MEETPITLEEMDSLLTRLQRMIVQGSGYHPGVERCAKFEVLGVCRFLANNQHHLDSVVVIRWSVGDEFFAKGKYRWKCKEGRIGCAINLG